MRPTVYRLAALVFRLVPSTLASDTRTERALVSLAGALPPQSALELIERLTEAAMLVLPSIFEAGTTV